MVRKILIGLILVGGLVATSNACYYRPELVDQGTWVNDGVTHYYDVFQYVEVSSGIDKNWETAKTYSATQISGTGWTLATVTSQAEQDNLNSVLQGLNGEYWLGGFQAAGATQPNEGWQWVTNEAWIYTNWEPGVEPNEWEGNKEQYLGTWSNYGWRWNDEHNGSGNISGFIAERTVPVAVPEPSTLSLLLMGCICVIAAAMKKRKA